MTNVLPFSHKTLTIDISNLILNPNSIPDTSGLPDDRLREISILSAQSAI